MSTRTLVIAVLLLALATVAHAQAATTFSWVAPDNVASLAEAQALIITLYVNGVSQPLPGVTCSGSLPAIACSAPIPAGVVQAIGTRYEITAKTATSGESPRSAPFLSLPRAPTSLRTQ